MQLTWKDRRFEGSLSDWLCQFTDAGRERETVRWCRGQMRLWAYHWRQSEVEAAAVGKPVYEIAHTNLFFAKMYRDCAGRGRL